MSPSCWVGKFQVLHNGCKFDPSIKLADGDFLKELLNKVGYAVCEEIEDNKECHVIEVDCSVWWSLCKQCCLDIGLFTMVPCK